MQSDVQNGTIFHEVDFFAAEHRVNLRAQPAGRHFEREAQLAILIGSLLAAAVGIAILLTSKAPVPD